MLIDHTLSLGITGCGVAPGIRTVEIDPSADPTYDTYFGYGGIQIRYSMLSHRFYSLAAGGLLGAGGTVTGNLSDSDSTSGSSSPDFVFVLEPQLAAYVTMTSWMRFGLIGSYRFAAGVDSAGLSSANVGGYTMGSQVQFGWL